MTGVDGNGPRIAVFAQVEVRGRDVHIMSVRNVSAGGVYLEGAASAYPELRPGVEFTLVIFGVEDGVGDDPDFHVTCRARVIRVDDGFPGKRPAGFGVTIEPADSDARERLVRLLARAAAYRPGNLVG